jgi:hypothetical protein
MAGPALVILLPAKEPTLSTCLLLWYSPAPRRNCLLAGVVAMAVHSHLNNSRRSSSRCWFVLGCVLAVAFLTALAEIYLDYFPTKDLKDYLGEKSPLTGIYVPNNDFGVAYRSWEAFCADNALRMSDYLPLVHRAGEPPLWAFFGNSFVQAPGMLADCARANVHDHRIFNLGRNELFFVRLAQVKLLLDNGLQPERIFVELMPTDTLPLGTQPLKTIRVTSKGALTYEPQLPGGPADWFVRHSRLAMTAWVRSGRQSGNPKFNKGTLYEGIEEPLRGDLERLFTNLARVAGAKNVPVTVLLIPAYHQVVLGASCGFQDTLRPMLDRLGYDVFDPREPFRNVANPKTLFMPDHHFNARGNQVLLAELLRHLERSACSGRHSAPSAGGNFLR